MPVNTIQTSPNNSRMKNQRFESACPSMYIQFQVPVSYSGIIYMIICGGTVVSSLMSDRITRKLGAGLVTTLSVTTTAIALFGFSFSSAYWMLCLWAIPYELGAGGVDAALNNYVACHYESRHMSWLHCMWGLGATVGPYIMEFALTGNQSWNMGYRYVMFIQIGLVFVLFLSLPLWKKKAVSNPLSEPEDGTTIPNEQKDNKPLSFLQILSLPGAIQLMIAFFSYEAVEQTAALWASSYLVLHIGFTSGTPWFYVNPNYKDINVKANENAEKSILKFYKELIALRKNPEYESILVNGATKPLFWEENRIFAYERVSENGDKIFVISNFQNKNRNYV